MATFATTVTRGMVIDEFAAAELMQEIAREVATHAASLRPRLIVSRGLGSLAGDATPPVAQRIRCLTTAPTVGARLGEPLARAYRRAIRDVVPGARHATTKALSVFALDPGVNLRLDLACAPALETDVTLTCVCRQAGDAEATCRVVQGFGRPPVLVSLRGCQAALLPALWPAELRAATPKGSLFAVVVRVGVETG
jgi:hypothetical protein